LADVISIKQYLTAKAQSPLSFRYFLLSAERAESKNSNQWPGILCTAMATPMILLLNLLISIIDLDDQMVAELSPCRPLNGKGKNSSSLRP
jgi:hypothetical protein